MGTPADTHIRTRYTAHSRAEFDLGHRAEVAAALRRLADWLLTHPQVRCPYTVVVTVIAMGETEDDERAEVDQAAAAMGVQPVEDGHYTAGIEFPGRVRLSVLHIPDAWRRRYDALCSYEPNIDLDEPDLS
jgi:hypothetical protein